MTLFLFTFPISIIPEKLVYTSHSEIKIIKENKENKENVSVKSMDKRIYLDLNEAWNLITFHETRQDSSRFNKKENAAGIAQIRPVMIEEINRLHGYEKYTLDDRWDINKSREIFFYIQKAYNRNKSVIDLYSICVTWNGKSRDNKYYRNVYRLYLKMRKNER